MKISQKHLITIKRNIIALNHMKQGSPVYNSLYNSICETIDEVDRSNPPRTETTFRDIYNDILEVYQLVQTAYETLDAYKICNPEYVNMAQNNLKKALEIIGTPAIEDDTCEK